MDNCDASSEHIGDTDCGEAEDAKEFSEESDTDSDREEDDPLWTPELNEQKFKTRSAQKSSKTGQQYPMILCAKLTTRLIFDYFEFSENVLVRFSQMNIIWQRNFLYNSCKIN